MAAVGRTARGLRRVPSYRPPRTPQREAPPQERERKRRPVRYKLFSLGAGLDMPLLIFILVLLAIGLVMLFSASYAYSYYYYGNSYFFISRQAAFAVFGVVAMLVISTFDYHHFHKLSVVVFGIAVFVLVAHMISQNLDRMGTFRYGVVPYVGIMGLVAALIFLESHLSATLIILMLGAILMFVGGTKPRWFVIGGIVLGVGLVLLLLTKGGYQMSRITIWLDPFSTELSRDATHQTRQSLYAIGSSLSSLPC